MKAFEFYANYYIFTTKIFVLITDYQKLKYQGTI